MEDRPEKLVFDIASESDSPSTRSTDTEVCFKYFGKLPLELRLIIWDMALPSRIIDMFVGESEPDNVSVLVSFKQPTIAKVCYESRELALRRGSMVFLKTSQPRDTMGSWTWFDSRHDTLRVNQSSVMEHIPRSVENIIFDWSALLNHSSEDQNMNFAIFPKLKLFQFDVDWRLLPQKIWTAWKYRIQSHQNARIILLDIDDKDEIQKFADVLLSRPEWHDLCQPWFKVISSLCKEKFRLYNTDKEEDWEVARTQLQKRWIKSRDENAALATGDLKDEARRAKMPEFRRVLSLLPFSDEKYGRIVNPPPNCFMLFDTTEQEGHRELGSGIVTTCFVQHLVT